MKLFFKYINYDPTGIKQSLYKLIDKRTKENTIRLEELSYHHNFETNLSYLNLNHQPWHDPWDITKKHTTSFFDLYNLALEETIQAITKVTTQLENKEINERELNILFKDLSYVTGIPCKEKVKMKYFEF